jgi:Arc/MetJ-type ribon-helix-helix transcriptional regulator
MKPWQVRLPSRFHNDLDGLVEKGIFMNKSEAIRAAVRDMLNSFYPGNRLTYGDFDGVFGGRSKS